MGSGLQAASLFVAAGIVLLFVLSALVIKERMATRTALGDGGHPRLMQAVRAHANCVETMPLVLLGLVVAGLLGAPALVIHAVGAILLAGRILHAMGMLQENTVNKHRQFGMMLTFAAMILSAGLCVWFGLTGHAS
jgi:uncharacterized protein